jgi:hypothetical protein
MFARFDDRSPLAFDGLKSAAVTCALALRTSVSTTGAFATSVALDAVHRFAARSALDQGFTRRPRASSEGFCGLFARNIRGESVRILNVNPFAVRGPPNRQTV